MAIIEIFEPAGCCATSSVVIDKNALHFNADMDWCKQQGLEIKRYNLLKNPQSFISNPRAKEFLEVSGAQSLPLTLVNGVVALTGRLPNREELARWSGAESAQASSMPPASCCNPTARA